MATLGSNTYIHKYKYIYIHMYSLGVGFFQRCLILGEMPLLVVSFKGLKPVNKDVSCKGMVLSETNSKCPLQNRPSPKEISSSNHPLSGAMMLC